MVDYKKEQKRRNRRQKRNLYIIFVLGYSNSKATFESTITLPHSI